MEKKNLLVQLFVPTAGELGRIGTAYPVAKNVLLTAAHVIDDANSSAVEASWWHLPGQDREWRNCGEILWDGRNLSPETDVVLLHCEFPKAVRFQWGTVTAARPTDHANWSSEGFPEVGDRHSRSVPIQGSTHSMGDRSDYFELAVTTPAETEEDWQGASGSPVFVDERIIGVIIQCPPHFRAGRMQAVPLFRLLKDDRFRKLVGYTREADDGSVLPELHVLANDVVQTWIESDPTFRQAVELQASIEFPRTQDRHVVERPRPLSLLRLLSQPESNANHSLHDVFYQNSRSMLIAGPPGCGKTTALLHLAKSLITDISRQDTALTSVPVVLALDSWTRKEKSFEAWCISELSKTYRVPTSLGRKWVDGRHLCLLLDGLDELGLQDRRSLVDALNSFQAEKGPPGIVVCSRWAEYSELIQPLRLNVAVILQPLEERHICTYLTKLGKPDLIDQLISDPTLRELSQTPLMIGILAMISTSDLDKAQSLSETNTSPNLSGILIDSFLTRMAEYQQDLPGGVTPEKFTATLAWLAKSMMDEKRRVLRIEAIQPGWAQDRLQIGVYVFLSRMLLGLVLWILVGTIVSLSRYLQDHSAIFCVFAMSWYLYVGCGGGLFLGAALFGNYMAQNDDAFRDGKGRVFSRVLVVYWILFFIGFVLYPESVALMMMGGFLLVGTLALSDATLNPTFDNEIQTVEALGWSWKSAFRGIAKSAIPGWIALNAILVMRVGGEVRINKEWVIGQLPLLGVVCISGFILGGLVRKKRRSKRDPNEGLLLSLRNMLLMGISGFVAGTLVMLVLIPLGNRFVPQDAIKSARVAIAESHRGFEALRGSQDKIPLPDSENMKGLLDEAERAIHENLEERLRSAEENRNKGLFVVMPPSARPGSGRSAAIEMCTWGLITGVVLAFIYGGIGLVRHFVLRSILRMSVRLPFRLSRLLCNSTDVAIMRRVGSGFMFTHIEIQRRIAAKKNS